MELDGYSHMDNHCEPEGGGTCNVPANRGFKSNMVRVSLVITCDVLSLSTNSGSLVPVTNVHVPGRLIVCDSCYY